MNTLFPLPAQPILQVNLLAAAFNNTSASYKFYWLLAIIDELESGTKEIRKQDLFAGMIANAWYTVNYFHVSFGQQDQLQRAIKLITETEGIAVDEKKSVIREKLKRSTNPTTLKALKYFDGEVPHRFLSPWLPGLQGHKKQMYAQSQRYENNCLYALAYNHIVINPQWFAYLQGNAGVIRAFCYWHLSLYLQKHNPNVPDIAGKLIRPATRNSLGKQRKLWNMVINELEAVDCIYTGKKLRVDQYAVEHFVPYAFVAHDLMWNLLPADPIFNSRKSDKLPSMERYFEAFFELQKAALEIIISKSPSEKLLEDYLSILPDLSLISTAPDQSFLKFRDSIQPLLTIASNNGFEFMI